MGIVFSIVILIITLIEQIILNIDNQIASETRPIVGADITIESNKDFDDQTYSNLKKIITDWWWDMFRMAEFYTTIEWFQEPKLVQVRAVEVWYPRYWELLVSSLDWKQKRNSKSNPINSGVWIDNQTYNLINKKNEIKLWSIYLPIVWIITEQASFWFNFLDEWRTLILPYNIIKKTNLTDFGSRIDYKIQVKTQNEKQAIIIKQNIEKEYEKLYQIRLAKDRLEQLWSIIWQLDQYTSILLITTLILSLIVMATATMTMTISIKNSIAIMRIIWITRSKTILMVIILFWFLFLFWYFIGVWFAYIIFDKVLSSIPISSDFIRYPEQLKVIWILSIISFFISCWEPLWYLSFTHPLLLLKQEWVKPKNSNILYIFILWFWSFVILSILNGNIFFSFFAIIFAGFVLFVWYRILMFIFVFLYNSFQTKRKKYFEWFDAIRQTTIDWNQTWILVGWLGIALVSFCVIVAISISFINRLDISALDQPNLFILNIRNEDISKIKSIEKDARLYDTILWRIVSINNISLKNHIINNKKETWEFAREFNMTSQKLENSPIIKGTEIDNWWISLDESFANRLGVWIWDLIEISIQWRNFELIVTSFRKSIRTWAEPFFFIKLDWNQFEKAPKSRFWVTKKQDWEMVKFKQLTLKTIWNHISFIDIGNIVKLITDIATKIIIIIFVCMWIVILLILLLSIASNEASSLVYQKIYRLYNIIWMTKKQLFKISIYTLTIYIFSILLIVLFLVPLILFLVYKNSTILIWSWSIFLILLLGIFITLFFMIFSYIFFHRLIIKSIWKK